MRSFKIFGYSIALAKKQQKTSSNGSDDKKRATGAIRKQAKRDVSFQIGDIKAALTLAGGETPDRSKLLDIYRYIKRDGHLKSQMRIAKAKVMSEPWMLYKEEAAEEKTTRLLNKRWFNHIIGYILESEFEGYSVVELNELTPQTGDVKEANLIDREYVSIENRWILIEGAVNGPYLSYEGIAWDIDLLEFGKRNDYGTLLECAYNIIWKFYSRSDWSRASEKFGMPILHIQAETNNDKELDDLENRAANFGADGYIVTQAGDKAIIIERTGQRMHDIYLDNVKLCNEEVSKIINGQTATSDQKAFVGSAEVQERVMEDITLDRLQMVVDEVNEKLLPYLEAKGFPVTGLQFDYPELRRIREKRLNGKSVTNDPKPQPGEEKDETKPKPVKED